MVECNFKVKPRVLFGNAQYYYCKITYLQNHVCDEEKCIFQKMLSDKK